MKDNKKQLKVIYKGDEVGTLALSKIGKVAFQYSENWINNGFSINPFSLPISKDVYIPSSSYLDGLFGVFYDSLPDAWGRLVADRMLKSKGINPDDINVLDRLAIVGKNGMGALEYIPEYDFISSSKQLSIDQLAIECQNVLESVSSDKLDELFTVAGSSGGARPKAFVKIDGSEWLIKFQYKLDEVNSGEKEYQYSVLAKKCGITMAETRLFTSAKSNGYFGSLRFDRPKVHMVSAAGLLEVDYNNNTCDYKDLLKLTNVITRGNSKEIQEMYIRMCFNVVFHNQDDHLKNFAFLYDDRHDKWSISPAFDITKSTTSFNEHTTTINGKGTNILDSDIIEVGLSSGLSKSFCIDKLELVKSMFRP